MRPIVRDRVSWSVGWSVCLSVGHSSEPCKMAEPIKMPFGIWIWTPVHGIKEACIRWECTQAPPGEYHWTIYVRRQCSMLYVILLWPLVTIVITSAKEYVFVVVCLTVSNLVQKFPNRFAWNFREGWQWASEQIINFWWRSKSQIRIRIWICIATLVRCALVEVCTVPVVLVIIVIIITDWLILLILQYQVLDLYRNTVKHMKHKKTFNIT